MVWGIIAAWLICLASLSLPWPGIVLVVLLCCVAFFELASPGGSDRAKTGVLCDAVRRSPSAAMTKAFHFMAERLGGTRRGGGKMEELATVVDKDAVVEYNKRAPSSAASSAQQTGATFLKGSVGSFSRGGLMVTREGRVIYKVNQDRGLISHPSLNRARHTVFGVFDGHGENGEHVAALTMREVPRRLELHPDALRDPASALEDVFLDINSSLPTSGINAVFGGCTAVVALVRGPRVWVANAGDSRALVAGRGVDGAVVARGLTRDQNPDSPGERERIEAMGGFVSDPEEPGASARVWLDKTRTLVGLAMARSIGDLAVKRVGVIALPEVTDYVLTAEDEFLVLASDGVWEFIDNQEAAEVVQSFFDKGEDAAGACKGLMELANRRWSGMVGDYRDDITATVVRLPFLPPAAAAAAAAAADDAAGDAATESSATDAPPSSATVPATAAIATTKALVGAGAATADGHGGGGASSSPSTESAAVTVAGEAPSSAASGKLTAATRALHAATRTQPAGSPSRPRARSTPIGCLKGSGDGGGRSGNDDGGDGNGDGKSTSRAATAVSLVSSVRSGDVLREEEYEEASDDDSVSALVAAEEEGEGRRLASTPVITPRVVGEEAEEGEEEEKKEEGEDTMKLLSNITKALVGRRASRSATAAAATAATSAPEAIAPLKGAFLPDGSDEAEDEGEELLAGEGEREEAAASDAEDWELNFGARENRQPSREMREASREFSSGSLDALVAGIDSRES